MNKNKISEFTLGLIKPQLSYNKNIIKDINQVEYFIYALKLI